MTVRGLIALIVGVEVLGYVLLFFLKPEWIGLG